MISLLSFAKADNSVMYSDWEATGRYDLHFVVKITSVKKAVSLTEKWIESIEQVEYLRSHSQI